MKHSIKKSELKNDAQELKTVFDFKRYLRKKFLTRLNKMNKSKVTKISKTICFRLGDLRNLNNFRYAAIYAAIGNEINLSEFALKMTELNITLCYPKFSKEKQEYELVAVNDPYKKLVKGYMGIPEPETNAEVFNNKTEYQELLWLVPGITFDEKGHRLGRGTGYYDRLLRNTKGTKIGIAYDWQVIDSVPVDYRDVYMDYLITETRHLNCFNRRKN